MPSGEIADGVARGLLALVTRALDRVLDGDDARPAVCQGLALLFRAAASAHARYDVESATSYLCMWRLEREGVASIVRLDQPEQLAGDSPAPAHRDWWLHSSARMAVLDWFGRPHLVELPLATSPPHQSLLVVGRTEAFTSSDVGALALARAHLLTLDRAVARLGPDTCTAGAGTTPEAALPSGLPSDMPTGPPPATSDLLTGREREVLLMLSEGLLARSIAQRLSVSERTVHKHLGNLYRKLDAHDRLLAVRRAETLGLLSAPAVPGPRRSTEGGSPPARW